MSEISPTSKKKIDLSVKKFRISVRDLVTFNLSDGSLGGSIQTSTRAVIGSREHRRIQDSRGEDYISEYSLKTMVEKSGVALEVYGRADGIYTGQMPPVIEEIKTTTVNNTSKQHMAQVTLYAYLYLIEQGLKGNQLDEVGIKLLYINIKTDEERVVEELYSKAYLTEFFRKFSGTYLDSLIEQNTWSEKRDQSLRDLPFPFDEFRPGQRAFSVATFRAVRDGETLFGRAPTGTGKSVASLFPALKAMAEGATSKIFYLTAKTVGRITARATIGLFRSKGAHLRSIVITAKEKSCINSEFNCSPDHCIYAKDYYSRIDKVIDICKKETDFHEERLKEIGYEHKVCPFELSLDLSTICDIVICDYNYVFDLRVQLKRFFEGVNGDYTLLIDEAHNLPARLKNCYSGSVDRLEIPAVVAVIKSESAFVAKALQEVDDYMISSCSTYSEEVTILSDVTKEFIDLLRGFTSKVETHLVNKEFQSKKLLLDCYYNMLFFIKLSELYTTGHRFLIKKSGGLGITMEIHSVDPSELATKMLLKSRSHIFFSATLNPIDYFTNLLLKDREYKVINIPSPFNPNNLKLIIRDDIKTTYRERSRYYQAVADSITQAVETKKGNYMVFFPSYAYMESVEKLMSIPVAIQKPQMSEEERKAYLKLFDGDGSLLSFAIMGGVFGEGIDLVGDRLIGVIVVGVGLPQISIYGDLMKGNFNYNYAYTYPGFNKVMQAVGRVIRHDDDRGIALLIDSRFNTPLYRNLFPDEWKGWALSRDSSDMSQKLKGFWQTI